MRFSRYFLILSSLSTLAISGTADAQKMAVLNGVVFDGVTSQKLVNANILIKDTNIGTATNRDGKFAFAGLPKGKYTLQVRYIGYSTREISLWYAGHDTTITVFLSRTTLSGPIVSVVATRAHERESPVTFATIDQQELAARHTIEDMPVLLSELPSTTYYSENGNGLGYNYLSIRGFDQRRISVMINGIPQNDPEDHNVYWIDFPDLAANLESVQVQRGAGSAFYGPAAIGGSVNLQTSFFSLDRQIMASYGRGGFDTQKYAFAFNSGLLKGAYVLHGRLSNMQSDGYRDRAWVKFWNYFFGASRYGKRSILRLHFYSSPIKDGLAYYGLPKFANADAVLRRKNFSYWKTDANADSLIDFADRRSDEIENFNQPHFELLHEYKIGAHVSLNNSAFFVRGYGFFDYDGSWGTPEYFRLTPEFGYHVDAIPANALIRAYVDNRQAGWLPQLTWQQARGEMVVGAELRLHRSLHWGRLQKGAGLPTEVVGAGARRYYSYRGGKDIASFYVHENFRLYPELYLMAELQYAYHRYKLYDEEFLGTDFSVPYHFVNPRLGVNFNASEQINLYTSISRTTREPRLKNLYDAAEASTPSNWGAVVPQFATNPDGALDFANPVVKPETLTDFELGVRYRGNRLNTAANFYFMDFRDEIINKGGLDRFGQPRTGNADQTLHRGVELAAKILLLPQISLGGNFLWSKNVLEHYTEFTAADEAIARDGNPIAGFPNTLGNIHLTYAWHQAFANLSAQFVGKQYTDNAQDPDRTVDAHTVLNFNCRYKFTAGWLRGLTLQALISNLLNTKYLMYGIGDEYFPAATRNVFLRVQYEI